jgi:hypothetical protein
MDAELAMAKVIADQTNWLEREIAPIRRPGASWNDLVVKPFEVSPRRKKWQRERTARNILFGMFLSIFCINLGLALLVNQFPRLRDPIFYDKLARLKQRLKSEPKKPLILALGSSRLAMGFDGQLIEAAHDNDTIIFNLGVPGSGPRIMNVYQQRLKQEGIKPDLLVLEVMPPLLGSPDELVSERVTIEPSRFTPADRETANRWTVQTASEDGTSIGLDLLPIYHSRYALLARVLPHWLPSGLRHDWGRKTDGSGMNPSRFQQVSPKEFNRQLAVAKKEYAHLMPLLDYSGNCNGNKAFEELIETAQRDNIRVMLLVSPEGPTFRSWYPVEKQQQLQEYLLALQSRYQVDCIDAQAWLGEEVFMDSHHLLGPGAKQFSQRLAGELFR